MADVDIGRLALEVPGLSAEQGQRLAEKVAEGLAGTRWTPTRPAEQVNVTVTAQPGDMGLERLAELIIAELRRQLT